MVMLVGIDWLKKQMASDDAQDLVIIDTRPKTAFVYGHIKNSWCVTLDQVIQMDEHGSNLVCSADVAQKVFGGIGIDDTKTVLVCGEYMDPSVFRMAWTLLFFGHDKTLILDSGVSAAQMAGVPFTRGVLGGKSTAVGGGGGGGRGVQPTQFIPRVNDGIRVQVDELTAESASYMLLDARSPAEYMGGHLPGAVLVPFTDGLGQRGVHFKDKSDLEALFLEKGVKKGDGDDNQNSIVCYCMHGHRAASLFFQLRQAGYTSIKLYDGSFVQWYGKKLPISSSSSSL